MLFSFLFPLPLEVVSLVPSSIGSLQVTTTGDEMSASLSGFSVRFLFLFPLCSSLFIFSRGGGGLFGHPVGFAGLVMTLDVTTSGPSATTPTVTAIPCSPSAPASLSAPASSLPGAQAGAGSALVVTPSDPSSSSGSVAMRAVPAVSPPPPGGGGLSYPPALFKFRFQAFNPAGAVRWSRYKATFSMALAAAGLIDPEHMKMTQFQVNPLELFDWTSSRFHPRAVETPAVSYGEIMAALDKRFKDRESAFMAECLFFRRVFNKASETVDDFIDDLHALAARADFGEFWTGALIGQILRGIGSDPLIDELDKGEGEPSLDGVIDRVRRYVQTDREGRIFDELHQHRRVPALLQITDAPVDRESGRVAARSTAPNVCFGCGSERHFWRDCPERETVCQLCAHVGHVASVCQSQSPVRPGSSPSAHSTDRRPSSTPRSRRTQNAHISPSATTSWVSESNASLDFTAPLFLRDYIHPKVHAPAAVFPLTLNGVTCSFQIGTGSLHTIISEADFRRFWPNAVLQPVPDALRTWDGHKLQLAGGYRFAVESGDTKQGRGRHVFWSGFCTGQGLVS